MVASLKEVFQEHSIDAFDASCPAHKIFDLECLKLLLEITGKKEQLKKIEKAEKKKEDMIERTPHRCVRCKLSRTQDF